MDSDLIANDSEQWNDSEVNSSLDDENRFQERSHSFHTLRSSGVGSVSLTLLDDVAESCHRQGNEIESIRYMERALLLRRELYGPESRDTTSCAELFIKRCNLVGMRFLKEGEKYFFFKQLILPLSDQVPSFSN